MKVLLLPAILTISTCMVSAQSGPVLSLKNGCGSSHGECVAGGAPTDLANDSAKTDAGNNLRADSRFDVIQFGAVGNLAKDDTVAIQAAFDACFKNGVQPYGGIVEFPGGKSYLISSTINAHDSCQIEGEGPGGSGTVYGSNEPPTLVWKGPAVGTVYSFSRFTAARNSI